MAKQLLLSVLVDTLGKYVEGLNDSNLKIGVWSGKVQLENLKLKSGVLDKLNLPITVKHGSLKKLKLKVPWASLDSKPVRVILDGLYIVASPLDISSLSPDQVKWMAAQDKKSKLQNAEMLILKTGESSNESGAGSKSSYLQHYAAKIADNLEITITNIHIRYEDSQTIQGAVFSTGITLDTLSLSTTDEFWNEMFVSRSAQHAIHKLGKVVNLGVYWNTNSEECTHMTPEARESWLEHLIYRASDRQSSPSPNPSTTKSSVSSLNYLLAPPNSLLIKIAHSDKPGPDDAMIDMTIEIPPFGITLDRLQYQQLMSTLVGFSRLARQKQMALYRPTKRPTRDPKGWWKYAFLLVTGKEFCVASKFDQFLQGLHYRKRYIELVKFMRRSGQGQGQSIADILAGKPPVPLTSEEAELEKIEDLLPVHMLIQFRRIAAIEMRASELKLQRPSSALTQKSSGSASTFSAETKSKKKSMMSWMWGSKSASTPKEATESSSFSLAIDEDVSIEQLVSELESAVEQAEKRAENQDLTQLRLNFSSKVIINLTSDHLPLAQLQVAVKAAIEAKAVSNVMSFYVDDFLFVDQYTRNPICPYLIAARTYRDAHNVGVKPSASQTNLDKLKQEGADLQSQLSVIFQTKANGALFLRITAAPVDIVWNRDCMQKLLAFLLSSQDVESLLSDRQMVVSMDKFASQVALPQASMDMIIEIDAPKIIIPENCSRSDCGGILLDTGVLCVKGHTSSLGISFGISLSAIHLGMPPNLDKFVVKTGHEIETMTVTQKSRYQPMSISYLIKPFSISLAMQTIETGLAEFTMAISVTDVQAEFDANKIIKLIRIFNTMTLSFAAANEEARLNVLSVSDATTDAIVKWSRGEVDQATNLSIQEDLDILKGVKQSPTIVMLGIMITIPSISITLRVGNNHFIRLVGSTIQATIQQRVYDMHVAFQLCSISLEDSLRCKNQTFLIWTEKDNEAIGGQNVESCLVTFVYKAISSKMSPYYRGFAGEIDLNFTKLSLSLDNLALIRLKPVATEISEGLAELQREFIIAEAAILGAQTVEKQNLRAVLVAKSVAVSALRGITVGIEVDNVSLLLLRRPTAQSARYSEEPMSPHLTTILGENLFSSREGASKSPLRSKSGMENIELETAFSLSISGLSFSMEALDTDMKLDVDLSSFTVVDVRPTVHYVFKELICQSTIASQYSTTHQKKAKRSQKTGFSPPPSSKEVKDSKLLSLIFKTSGPPSAQVQHLDITLRNITSFLNLDAVLELADICMTDVDAFLGLLACFNNEPAVETKPTSVETLHGSPVVVSKNNISRPIEKSQPKRPDRVASIQPTGQKVPSLHVEEDAPMTSCFSVHVAVTNPRIILMENPERRNSRAIVCPFEIMFTYSNDTQDVKKSEMREIIQASLRDFEIFVLLEGVDSSKQHQIVEPTGIELHLSRRMEENILLSCSMYCDSRTVNGKVSVSDIKLVTKILNKAQLTTESTMKKQQSNRNVTPDKQALRRSIDNSQQLSLRQSLDKKQTSGKSVKDLAVYEITLHFGSIRIIAINDYYGQILPVLRMRLNDSDFHGTGILGMGDFFATGNFILSVEYFNAPLGVWEPILERCTPELTFTSKDERNMSFEVSHLSGILQITASGTMIREVSKTALLVTRSDLATANDCVVEEGSLLSFRNRLGVPIDVFESSSKRLVLSLPDYQIVQFPIEKFLTKAARASDNPLASFPNYFDIRVKGGYEDEREPLLALPLNVSKSKMYFLQPTAEIGAASATIPIEPILEEIYECERYSPMLQRWTDPWIGDPPRWTDAFARSKSAPDEFEINSRWHWLEPEWTVECLPNEKGKNVDAEGWQYGSVFGLFYSSTQKRTQKPADCCRRRKWVRTRTMADINQHRVDERKLAPIPIYWEPSIDKRTGCRLVEIKSCFQIKNTLKFPVQILLGGLACNSRNNSHGKDSSLYDSIPPNENWSVPLKLSHASSLHVRPLGVELNGAEVDGDWSQQFDCGLSTLGAKDRGRTMTLHADCPCGVDSNITFKVLLRRTGQLLTVVFAPYAVIHNYLPCTLHYRTLYGEGDVGQKGQLNPGHSDFFSSLDVHKKPKLSITAGTSVSGIGATPGIFHWSNQISFKEYLDDASKSLQMVVDIVDKNSSEKSVMSVVIATKMMTSDDGADYLAIFIYSKFILVNRTHIPISIRGFRNTNQNGSDKKPNYIPQERRSFGALSVRDLEGSWAKGSNNVVLFHSDNDDVQIGVDDGETWSSLISLSEVGVPKTQFEVNNPSRHVTYPLAYSLVTLPGLFRQTQVLTVMAGFMVVNTLSEKVSLEQVFNGSSNSKRDVDVDLLSVDPQCSSAWIKSLDARDMRVRLRTGSTQWSYGCVDLAGVGTTVLILPRMISTNTTAGDSGGLAVVHVEVKLSDASDHSYVSIVIWSTEKENTPDSNVATASLSFQNLTDQPLTLLQAGADKVLTANKIEINKFDLSVGPNSWKSFGWVDPNLKSEIKVVVGTSSISKHFTIVDMDSIGATYSLEAYPDDLDGDMSTVLELSVLASSCGKILRAVRTTRQEVIKRQLSGDVSAMLAHSSEDIQKNANADDTNIISMKISVKSLGLSLIADGNNKGSLFKEYRREMFSLHLEGIEAKYIEQSVITKADEKNASGSRMFDGTTTSLSLRILDAQIDNYCKSAVFPVLMMTCSEKRRRRAEKRTTNEKQPVKVDVSKFDDVNFFLLSAVKVIPKGSTSSIYEYIAMRMLSVQLAIDSGSLQLYLLDLHQDVVSSLGGTDGALAEENPAEWVAAYNKRTVVPESSIELVNVVRAKLAAQADKMYIEKLIIHPFKITVSYIHTNLPGDRYNDDEFMAPEFRWLKLARDMAYLDSSSLTLKSFIVEGAMESPESLSARLVETYVQSLLSQLVNIAGNIFGSLKIVGKPLDLVKNIGHGVKDFFYEPYLGAMESPEEFVRGMGSGAGSLLTHIIGGTISTGANVIEGVTTNLAVGNTLLLSGDADYARHITDKRRLNSASTGGVLSGLKAGGESVLTGFASGIGGLISRPLDGMKENGAVGFMKGLGLGAVEAVFKPVVGLTDGVANIAHGISNELGQLHRAVPQVIRPQRALCRSPVDYDIRIVTPININACMAQELLKKLAQKEGRSDNYVASVVVQGRRKPGASTFSHENISVFERQDGQEHTAVLTEDIVFLMVTTRDRNIAEWVYAYKEISHCLLHVDLSTVEIVLYSRDATTVLSTNKTVSITCDTAQLAWELYCALYFMNFRMGNRSSMVPPEKLAIEAKLELTIGGDDNTGQGEDDEEDIEIAGENSHPMTKAHIINPNSVGSQDIRIGFSDYQFGTANLKTYPGTMLSEDQLLKKHIDLMSEAYWPDTDDNSSDHHTGMIPAAQLLRHMDECCWHFIYDWRSAHGPLNPGRCIAVLIINQSDHIVQITTLQLLEGRGMIVCPMGASSGYDADMRILQPRGGACTVFCYGYQYTFVNPAHVKLQINCSAFSGMFTTRMETKTTSNTSIGENGGHKVSFVEKSFTDWWGKYVVLIR